jgi:23S rRNA (uracil1939-C5)-methyltransferase
VPDAERRIPRIGDEVEITIESVAFGGDGVARLENYVLFVPDVITGETVTARITEIKRSYGRGVTIRIRQPSPDRVEPVCDVYGLCGGCQYQHVAYERSLESKERQVEEVMLRIGRLSIGSVCEPMLPAPHPYGYRNAVSLHVGEAKGKRRVGYVARDNRAFVPISRCPIASKEINESLGDIGAMLRGFDRPERIKGLTIKNAETQTLIHPVYHKPMRFSSDDRLCYRYKHIVFHYGPRSFFQVNHSMIPSLLDLAREGLAPEAGEMLLDLYAGVGLFSLALAEGYRRVVGIEDGEEAVACFEANIGENKIRNVRVVRGRVEGNLKAARREIEGKTVSVLVDPPREGLSGSVIEFLKATHIRKLVYVSCDPATLARDLRALSGIYRLEKITPLDMFPQTKHIETVTVLGQ